MLLSGVQSSAATDVLSLVQSIVGAIANVQVEKILTHRTAPARGHTYDRGTPIERHKFGQFGTRFKGTMAPDSSIEPYVSLETHRSRVRITRKPTRPEAWEPAERLAAAFFSLREVPADRQIAEFQPRSLRLPQWYER